MILKYFKTLLNTHASRINNERRNLNIRKFKKNEYATLDDYLNKDNYKTEVSTIWFDVVPLDLIFQFNALSKPLFIFFHGAVDQSKTITPHFVGLSYKRVISANLLHIADSSLIYDKSIRSGWYLGCQNIPLQQVIQKIATHLATFLETTKIIFFGSSGGGFPSLCLSQTIPNSLAIVNSPATSVINHPHRATRVSQYLKEAFCTQTEKDEDHVLKDMVKSDLREGFDLDSGIVLYLLNINDKGNLKLHTDPFFKQFSEDINFNDSQVQRFGNLYLITDDWGPGHRYPPPRFLNKIFAKVTEDGTGWSDDQFEVFFRQQSIL